MIENKLLEKLLTDIYNLYGYDFTQYSKASLQRRINSFYTKSKITDYAEFLEKLAYQPYFTNFIEEITVNVTEMFRDPSFYKALKEKVIPVLATYPFIRVWHAGCSTGEEVYSLAILLKEAGILDKSLLYATDINESVIKNAKSGIFPIQIMKNYTENYVSAGGLADFSTYYQANYNLAKFDASLTKRMVFSTHNLVSDSSFNEFQLIICRNVLIYFNQELQDKVLQLFDKSLEKLGFLALGSKESLRFSIVADKYTQIDTKDKLWRKSK